MARSSKKGPYVDARLLEKILKRRSNGVKEMIKTWARDSQIPPEFVNQTLAIHNGKRFIEVFISEAMVGHRLGEFSPTRTFHGHGKMTKKTLSKT